MNVKPLGDRVVIKMVDYEEKTKGGLFITANAQDKPEIAEVISPTPVTSQLDGVRVKLDYDKYHESIENVIIDGRKLSEISEIKKSKM